MEKVLLNSELEISRIVHGNWRLNDWNMSKYELSRFIHNAVEYGVTSFDHADIYGNHTCEEKFGDALSLSPGLRDNIQLITKCGIKLASDKFPERKIKYYDYSYKHITESVNSSLINFKTDYIDVLLLHRPSPFINGEEVAQAFQELKTSGKVKVFGVSNFLREHVELLDSFIEEIIPVNQVEISPYCLEHFENGNVDFMYSEDIYPMAWSPLAGGELMNPKTEKGLRIFKVLKEISDEISEPNIEKIIYKWLLMHPSGIIPVSGTGKSERLKNAVDAFELELSLEQWFRIYTASLGQGVP